MCKLHKFDVDWHGNPTLVGGSVSLANGPGTATSTSPSLILDIKPLCCLDGLDVCSLNCLHLRVDQVTDHHAVCPCDCKRGSSDEFSEELDRCRAGV